MIRAASGLNDLNCALDSEHRGGEPVGDCGKGESTNALRRLPKIMFHATIGCNAVGIRQEGLHCASTLMQDSNYRAPHLYRDRTLILPSGAALRDQRPMAPALLSRCLEPTLSVKDWYRLVNARVFFWLDSVRLASYVKASAGFGQVVYTIDATALAVKYANSMEVTPFNVGYAKRRGALRGLRTFVSLSDWTRTGWANERATGRSSRAASCSPVEVAVRGSILDFHRYVIEQRVIPANA